MTEIPKQTALFPAGPPIKRVSVEHEVDYSQMVIGTGVGSGTLITCGVCGKPGLGKHNDANLVWVHAAIITSDGIGNARHKRGKSCRMRRF